MRSKELSVDLRDRIVLRHNLGEGYKNISAELKVPKNTVASIILKLKKFGTTKLSNRGRRASMERRESSRRTAISAALDQSGLYGRVARQKPLLSKRHMTACLEFAKWHLNKIVWSDETKI